MRIRAVLTAAAVLCAGCGLVEDSRSSDAAPSPGNPERTPATVPERSAERPSPSVAPPTEPPTTAPSATETPVVEPSETQPPGNSGQLPPELEAAMATAAWCNELDSFQDYSNQAMQATSVDQARSALEAALAALDAASSLAPEDMSGQFGLARSRLSEVIIESASAANPGEVTLLMLVALEDEYQGVTEFLNSATARCTSPGSPLLNEGRSAREWFQAITGL